MNRNWLPIGCMRNELGADVEMLARTGGHRTPAEREVLDAARAAAVAVDERDPQRGRGERPSLELREVRRPLLREGLEGLLRLGAAQTLREDLDLRLHALQEGGDIAHEPLGLGQ